MERINSMVGCSQCGYVSYPPCTRCYKPDKELGGGAVDGRPVCADCYIKWLMCEY